MRLKMSVTYLITSIILSLSCAVANNLRRGCFECATCGRFLSNVRFISTPESRLICEPCVTKASEPLPSTIIYQDQNSLQTNTQLSEPSELTHAHAHEPTHEPIHEPVTVPATEPATLPATEPATEPVTEPMSKHIPEPTPEPTPSNPEPQLPHTEPKQNNEPNGNINNNNHKPANGTLGHRPKSYVRGTHYKHSKACPGCKKDVHISGERVIAMGTVWHRECFVCTQCRKPFPGNRYCIFLYCLFANKC